VTGWCIRFKEAKGEAGDSASGHWRGMGGQHPAELGCVGRRAN
jgi:hypothetical protein